MFYCIDLLRKNGKFSVIWLAATKENSLKKRDFMLVHLDKTCSDLKDYIMHERNRPRLSLYLSSQLLYGAIKVYSRQIKYLLGDTMELFMRIRFQPSVVLNIQDVAPRRGKKRKFQMDSPKYTIELPMMDIMGFDINSSLNLPSISELPTVEEFLIPTEMPALDDSLAHTVPREEITLLEDPPNMPHLQVELFDEEEMFKSDLLLEKEISKDYLSNIEEPVTARKADISEPEFIPLLRPKVPPARQSHSERIVEVPLLDICLSPLVDIPILKRRKRPRALLIDSVIQFTKDDIRKNIKDTSPIVCPFIERIDTKFKSAVWLMNEPMRSSMLEVPLKKMMKKNMSIHPRLVQDTSPEPILPIDVHKEKCNLPVRRRLDLPKHMSTPLDNGAALSKPESSMQVLRDASSFKDSVHLLSRSNISTIGSRSVSRIQEFPPVPQLMFNDSLRESFIEEQLRDSVMSHEDQPVMPTFEKVVQRLMEEYKHVKKRLTFKDICPTSVSRKDAVKCFTELLGGIKDGKWSCRQWQPFGDIEICNCSLRSC